MQTQETLGIISGLLILPALTTYFIQIRKGDSTPNIATWLTRSEVMVFNAITYAIIVGNVLEGFIAIITPLSPILVLSYTAVTKKFTSPKTLELVTILLSTIIGILWMITDPPSLNICLQIILFISIVPTATRLISKKTKHETKEKPLPWIIASIAYTIAIINVSMNLHHGYMKLLFPINGLICNGSIAIISFIKNQKRAS